MSENGPVQISRLSFVDLDRSEGAHVKDEKGNCIDRSSECLRLAITARSKREEFNYSKSKLTRILKSLLAGNSITAIICNITPTVLAQSIDSLKWATFFKINLLIARWLFTHVLSFAAEAKQVETQAVCNEDHTDDVIIKQVRASIARMKELQAELQPLLISDSGKINDQIAEMESIFLMDMRSSKPKQHSLMPLESVRVLKIRPFFDGFDKKYQIGEMDGQCIDAQSR